MSMSCPPPLRCRRQGRELPDDLVADVLRRLPPRSLAVCRCACRAWRDLVDGRRLLRAELLPRTVAGIFMSYRSHHVSEFLARPTTGASISSDLVELIEGVFEVVDHCNGLLICTQTLYAGDAAVDCVVNPATRQWAWLPLPPQQMRKEGFRQSQCLVYDPTVSPHYHVFLIGLSLSQEDQHKSALPVCVYSSETGRWEERWFAPEVPVVETTIAVAEETRLIKVYWRGRLYFLCEKGHVLRISISNANYRLIPSPEVAHFVWYPGFFSLGRSEKGVYCAFEYDSDQFQIFLLNESCGQTVWDLTHSADLSDFADKLYDDNKPNGPWTLEDIKYKYSYRGNDKHKKVVEDRFEWNSDEDNVFSTEDMVEGRYTAGYTIRLLGFHPYKEVVFLDAGLSRAIAYHWNSSKFQDLGNICPKDYLHRLEADIETSFIYTPCWMEDFPQSTLQAPIESSCGGIN